MLDTLARHISHETRHSPTVGPMLGYCPGRWPNIDPMVGECRVFADLLIPAGRINVGFVSVQH